MSSKNAFNIVFYLDCSFRYASVRQAYDQLVEKSQLKGGDKYQLKVIKELDRLKIEIEKYNPEFSKSSSPFTLSSLWKNTKKEMVVTNAPKGLYIYGAVGVGKTMLADLFFENADVKEKKRMHFQEFMESFHKRKAVRRFY